MSKDAFNSCIKDTKALEKLQAKMDVYITQHQIDSTPSFIINDKKFAYTGGGIAEFDAALKPLLVAK
jgi:protein-disulfide isomerase